MSIEDRLRQLEQLEGVQLKLVQRVLKAYDSALYPMDLLTVAVVNRSMALSAGFRQMIEAKNLICAGAMLRLQIDTVARFSAAWRVENPHDFALNVLAGKQVRRMRSADGKMLTDRYLVGCLVPEADWLQRVYEKTSGYVHLSDTHFMAALSPGEAERSLRMKISSIDKPLPDDLYVEALDAFIAATDLLMTYVLGWGVTKDHPEITRHGKAADPDRDA